MSAYPVLLHTAIDAQDCRGLAEFYRELLGLHYEMARSHRATAVPMTRTGWSCSTTEATAW
jgi:hypothetical protein